MSLKIFSLLPHLDNLCLLVDDEKPHITCIDETKLDSSIDDSLIQIDDYVIVRKDRNVHSGGVALYRVSQKEYTLLTIHNTASIASILKIWLGLDR